MGSRLPSCPSGCGRGLEAFLCFRVKLPSFVSLAVPLDSCPSRGRDLAGSPRLDPFCSLGDSKRESFWPLPILFFTLSLARTTALPRIIRLG